MLVFIFEIVNTQTEVTPSRQCESVALVTLTRDWRRSKLCDSSCKTSAIHDWRYALDPFRANARGAQNASQARTRCDVCVELTELEAPDWC